MESPAPSGIEKKVVVNRKVFRGRNEGAVSDAYNWEEKVELGSGSFGKVFRAKSSLDPKKVVAIKLISKDVCEDLDELWTEIGILSEMDHPHVLRFLEAYDDFRNVYIVTELCLGGDLVKILPTVCGDLYFASRVCLEVTSALSFCHAKGVCHRDLKPDNILLVRASIDSPVRVADFGVAHQVQEAACKVVMQRAHQYCQNQREKAAKKPQGRSLVRLTSFKGTPEFMAPEVLSVLNASVNNTGQMAFYDFRCDVWSLGVIIYILMSGQEPYALEEVAAYVENGTPLAELKLEERIDDSNARDFLARCLNPVYESRPHTDELLKDPFVEAQIERAKNGNSGMANGSWKQDVADNLKGYVQTSHFKKAALTASVRHLSALEHEQLRETFQAIDTNHTGTITLEELKSALQTKMKGEVEWVMQAFEAMDTDLSGEVDYTEFLAASMDSNIEDRRDLVWAAFRAFDTDGDGTISKAELKHVVEDQELSGLLGELTNSDKEAHETVQEMMRIADTDNDGSISFQEFLGVLKLG